MLEYLTDIMEDAQDFGWASAKGAHALILCRMSHKLDRLRQAHAPKIVTSQSMSSQNKVKAESQNVKNKKTSRALQ